MFWLLFFALPLFLFFSVVFWFVFLGSASGCLRFFWGCFSSGLFFCRPAAVKFRRKSLCFEAFFFCGLLFLLFLFCFGVCFAVFGPDRVKNFFGRFFVVCVLKRP